MVVISKHHLDAPWAHGPCYEIVHPWEKSCLKAAPTYIAACLLGNAKFFALFYFVQAVIGRKKLQKKEHWLKIAKNYLRSTMTGMLITSTSIALVCLLRNLLGKYTYWSAIIPFTLSGLWIYIETPSKRRWMLNGYSNMLIEYFLRCLERAGYISISKTKTVLMFMMGNALLLYLMRLEADKGGESSLFWIFTPEKVRKESDECTNVCPHEGDCQKYILKGASAYFGVALAISIIKVIVPRIRTPIKAISSIRARHLKLAFFLSSYVGIYKAIICFLCRKNGFDSALYALPAGYLAGLSFAFSQSLTLAIAPFTAAFKVYSTTLYEKKILPSNIHLPIALCCFCQGILFNGLIKEPDVCPSYAYTIMNITSNGLGTDLMRNFHETIKNSL